MQRTPVGHRLLLYVTLAVSLCVGGWWGANAGQLTRPGAPGVPGAHEAIAAHAAALRSLTVDVDRSGAKNGGALQVTSLLPAHVSASDGRSQRNPLGVTDVAGWASRQLRVTLDESSNTDNSDQSDGAAHVEPRAGPIAIEPSRALFAVVEAAPRSRTHSASTPRAPPLSLRFA